MFITMTIFIPSLFYQHC